MTDWMDQSEEAYKNGFKQGYTEGLGDRASELLDGAIRWHKRFPDHDISHCFVVYRSLDGATKVYLAAFYNGACSFVVDNWGVVDAWDPNYVMWGEYRPVAFTSPGVDG